MSEQICDFCGKQHEHIPWCIDDIAQQAEHCILTDQDLKEIYIIIWTEMIKRGTEKAS